MKKKFIIGIKANRLIACSEEDRKNGQYQNLNTLDIKDGEKRIFWLKAVSSMKHVALKYKLLIEENQMVFQ
jgi:hypothetical protein